MRKTKMALAFCLITALLFSPLAAMDDHGGAIVVVTKKDGTLTQGVLMAVKRNALVVSAGETSTGESIPNVLEEKNVSIAIEDIRKVEVIKKSKILEGMAWGILAGGVIGAASGAVAGPSINFLFGPIGTEAGFEYGGLIGGASGLIIGAIVGASISAKKTFRFDFSKEDRETALLQLSEYAAIKGVR